MNIKLLFAVLVFNVAAGCNKSDNGSETGDPTEDIAWLKSKKLELSETCGCTPTIWSATYEGRMIYEIGCSGATCFCSHSYYEENGKSVSGSDNGNREAFLSKVKSRKRLWACGE